MTMHMTARIAWHMDGWNGHICKNPAANTYCVGQHSYPGQMVAERRDLKWETEHKGECCSKLDAIPPCVYGINAFGTKELTAFADPPDFFHDDTETRQWTVPPATICTWPYEEMYREETKTTTDNGKSYHDNEARLEGARNYFAQIAEDRSLIFYYANYSNPFSEEDQKCYVVIGVSRIKEVGEELFYDNCSDQTKERYAGGFVWDRNITSHYPDQGFRLPYHVYLKDPKKVEKFLFIPDNPRHFKYGTRLITDDDALDLVERLLEIALTLKDDLKDKSENWSERIAWLQSLIAELWTGRGLYPGLPHVLDYIGFHGAIPYFKAMHVKEKEQEGKDAVFAYLDGKGKAPAGLAITADEEKSVRRQWKLKEAAEIKLLRDVFPRFGVVKDQIERILADKRSGNGIEATLDDIADNPYILSEQFRGDNEDDTILFNKIDHGVFPSPDLGGKPLSEKDDWRRLRGLCVEQLQREQKHTFVAGGLLLQGVNHRLAALPDWKRHQFKEKYFEHDETELSNALVFRNDDKRRYVYLKTVFDDEREIEKQLRFLAKGPDIRFKVPVTERHWHDFLFDSDSELAKKNPKEYEKAIAGQATVCQRVFTQHVSVLSGAAGTGKTTVIKAIIQAIERAHGDGTSFQLLAPTGKAADRIRGATGKDAKTIHSFLATNGWLNDNMTFKRSGGRQVGGVSTFIVDESSMLDLELCAALFRAIDWRQVQRLIFVGDSNQLPPIGRGRVFADIIEWLVQQKPESVATLQTNIRQMENTFSGKGTGILRLASLYIKTIGDASQATTPESEELLQQIQEGGDVAKDLRVVYWKNPQELASKLVKTIVKDMEADTESTFDPDRPYDIWRGAFKDKAGGLDRPEYMQAISPYRSDEFGTDTLNLLLQRSRHGRELEHGKHLGGIGIFDKVIQIANRTKSNPAWSWNVAAKKNEKLQLFNGEMGFVKKHGLDGDSWKKNLSRIQVVFSRHPGHWVDYSSNGAVEQNLELAYAISVHKAQGSEFDRVYFILPKHKQTLLSREMFYTGVTRAKKHCTIFAEEDIGPFLSMRRPERSALLGINASLFAFNPLPDELLTIKDWYAEGKIHNTLADVMVRSKSEVIISNQLAAGNVPFSYEMPLYASDGSMYLPDFTITWRGEQYFWEHLGMLDQKKYRDHWNEKKAWYEKHFPGQLVTTEESGNLSKDAAKLIRDNFS